MTKSETKLPAHGEATCSHCETLARQNNDLSLAKLLLVIEVRQYRKVMEECVDEMKKFQGVEGKNLSVVVIPKKQLAHRASDFSFPAVVFSGSCQRD